MTQEKLASPPAVNRHSLIWISYLQVSVKVRETFNAAAISLYIPLALFTLPVSMESILNVSSYALRYEALFFLRFPGPLGWLCSFEVLFVGGRFLSPTSTASPNSEELLEVQSDSHLVR